MKVYLANFSVVDSQIVFITCQSQTLRPVIFYLSGLFRAVQIQGPCYFLAVAGLLYLAYQSFYLHPGGKCCFVFLTSHCGAVGV